LDEKQRFCFAWKGAPFDQALAFRALQELKPGGTRSIRADLAFVRGRSLSTPAGGRLNSGFYGSRMVDYADLFYVCQAHGYAATTWTASG
jgi:hypothetical protein